MRCSCLVTTGQYTYSMDSHVQRDGKLETTLAATYCMQQLHSSARHCVDVYLSHSVSCPRPRRDTRLTFHIVRVAGFSSLLLPGRVGEGHGGARGPVLAAASGRRAHPGASPRGLGPTPRVLPLVRPPHDRHRLLLGGRLHGPAEGAENTISLSLISPGGGGGSMSNGGECAAPQETVTL